MCSWISVNTTLVSFVAWIMCENKDYVFGSLIVSLLIMTTLRSPGVSWNNYFNKCLSLDPFPLWTCICVSAHTLISSSNKFKGTPEGSNFSIQAFDCLLSYVVCRIKTGSGGVCCHNARGRVRNRKSNPDGVAGGIWRTVRTSPSALWQQTPTDRS